MVIPVFQAKVCSFFVHFGVSQAQVGCIEKRRNDAYLLNSCGVMCKSWERDSRSSELARLGLYPFVLLGFFRLEVVGQVGNDERRFITNSHHQHRIAGIKVDTVLAADDKAVVLSTRPEVATNSTACRCGVHRLRRRLACQQRGAARAVSLYQTQLGISIPTANKPSNDLACTP